MPLIAGAIFVALNVVAVWGGYRYFLKCREVNQLRYQRQLLTMMSSEQITNIDWDAMCADMEADATGTATAAKYVFRDYDERHHHHHRLDERR